MARSRFGAPGVRGAAFIAGVIGLNCAILHLGRPLYAFRAILGFRTSWMSREIVAFSAYLPRRALTPPRSGCHGSEFSSRKIGLLRFKQGQSSRACSAFSVR